ncbi:MAG TPA: hypothetical protein VEI97_19335 [bacterium]|nr:hypothetical protein [bacterium]
MSVRALCAPLLVAACLALGCQKSASPKNAHGLPVLQPPAGGAPAEVPAVPAELIPPGAQPMKTDTGVSSRYYQSTDSASKLKEFFQGALQGAKVEEERSGQHLTLTGGGWVIEVIGNGEDPGAGATIIYAKSSEVGE